MVQDELKDLDMGVDTYFRGSKDEECYGRVKLQPLIFVDDLLRGAKDVNCLRAGCIKLDYVLRSKQLQAHPTKSGILIFGSEKFKAKAQRDLSCRACPSNPTTGVAGKEDESQEHLEECKGYSDLWQELGLLTPLARARYFLRVKNRRTKEQTKIV